MAKLSHLHKTYTYCETETFENGWNLVDSDRTGPEIQTLDVTSAFASDADAALHVIRAAAFDAGQEGSAARAALRTIVDFGFQGINPIATKIDAVTNKPNEAVEA